MDIAVEQTKSVEPSMQSRRDHILEAAAVCFARTGFHGTSMHEICQEAAMSAGALYRYFRSKDEIISAIAEQERARNLSILATGNDGLSFIDHIVRLGVCFLTEMARPGQAALFAEVVAETLRNSDIGVRFQANQAECRAIFRKLTEKAVANGEIEAPDDLDATMSCVMAIGEGLVLRMAAEPDVTVDRIAPFLETTIKALFKVRPGAAE